MKPKSSEIPNIMKVNQLSETLLRQVRTRHPYSTTLERLAHLPPDALSPALDTDARRKAFWINLYNAAFLILRRDRGVAKPAVFRDRSLTVAGRRFSLDDIEHGILRRYRFKWALGYLPDPLAPRYIRRLALRRPDFRIHFALNCGARGCPPIAFYSPDRVEAQLEGAMQAFLETETEVRPDQNEVHVSRLFLWYLGDFGGRRGIRRLLREVLDVDTTGKRLVFRPYDWTEQLDRFSENPAG